MPLASDVINRVRTQLIDLGSTQHWTDAELLQWLSDGQRAVVAANPTCASKRAVVNLIAGTRQTIPSDGHVLLDIERNVLPGGTWGIAIRKVDQTGMDAIMPMWHAAAPTSQPRQWVYNPLMQDDFYVYPPNDGTGQIEIIYAVNPPELTALTQSLSVLPILQTPLVDYVLWRACLKDSDFSGGPNNATVFMNAFLAAMQSGTAGTAQDMPSGDPAS